jgi:RimJ/RimL family protein N-acetyltransferase
VKPTCIETNRLQSERLVLEPLRVQHADDLAPVLSDAELHRFIGGHPADVKELRDRFARQVRGPSPETGDAWLNWAVRERAGARMTGTVQATVRTTGHVTRAELAWIIGTAHQGQGFAKEAAALVAEWFRRRSIYCLLAHIHPGHEASMRVARSIGLSPTVVRIAGELRWQSLSCS